MIDTSGFFVMGVGIVSAMVVNLFVSKNKCPKHSLSLQAYSEPDEFPLPIPESLYGGSKNGVKVESRLDEREIRKDTPRREEGLKAATKNPVNIEQNQNVKAKNRIEEQNVNVGEKNSLLQNRTIHNEPTATMARSLSNPFIRKLDLKGTISQGSLSFVSSSRTQNLELPPESSSQGDQTVIEIVANDQKTEEISTSEGISQGDSISKDLSKDLSSYTSSLSWEDAFVEREPFIQPVQDFSKAGRHPKKSPLTKNKTV